MLRIGRGVLPTMDRRLRSRRGACLRADRPVLRTLDRKWMVVIAADMYILFPEIDLKLAESPYEWAVRRGFAGFKIASPEELDTALREAVVAIDANVLLDLYRFRPQYSRPHEDSQ